MNLNENDIRDLAYQIWESEGRPHGQAARHWDIACKLAADPISQGAGGSAQQQADTGTESRAESRAETKPVRKSKPKSAPQMG